MSDLDRVRPGFDVSQEHLRLSLRRRRATMLRDLWWLIVKDAKGWDRHPGLVRWARAGLELDEPILPGAH